LPDPWTQTIGLSWRPELSFYEKRIEILKALEKKEILRAFRVEDRFVDAQLFETRDLLSVRQDGLSLELFSPSADPERAIQAVEIAIAGIVPKAPRRIKASFQFIVDLELGFEAAIEAAHGGIFHAFGPSSLTFGDWAVLLDFNLDEQQAVGQAEFGVIAQQEALRRLTREAGRKPQRPEMQTQGRWKRADFPEVSVFVDGYLEKGLAEDAGEDLVAIAIGFLGSTRSQLSDFSASLVKMLRPNSIGKAEAG